MAARRPSGGDCMKHIKVGFAAAVVIALGAISFRVAQAQQGPGTDSSETVAKPRKKNPPADAAPDPTSSSPATSSSTTSSPTTSSPAPTNDEPVVDEPKIPSKFNKKEKELPADAPTFSSDVNTVELDVAVLDNKGKFLSGIPKDKFRILEDNVPQQIASFNVNSDAPMTVAMVIEFSNLYQQY